MKTANTEQAILQAAEEMFLEKGFAMVSTTDIANKVGCNQAMVHYYYRTKENLFMKVFTNKIDTLFKTFSNIIKTEHSLFDRITITIDNYFELFQNNPRIPFLVVNELILNPTRRKYMRDYIINSSISDFYYEFDRQVAKEIKMGNIRKITTFDLLQNIISLTAFAFVCSPVLEDVLTESKFSLEDYFQHRNVEIKTLIIQGLRPMQK